MKTRKQHIRMVGGNWCLFASRGAIFAICIARTFRRLLACRHIR